MSEMHNPPHPGGVIEESLEFYRLSINAAARLLHVAPSTLQRVMRGKNAISPELAVKLEAAGIGAARVWIAMQNDHDLWHARQSVDVSDITPLSAPPEEEQEPAA